MKNNQKLKTQKHKIDHNKQATHHFLKKENFPPLILYLLGF